MDLERSLNELLRGGCNHPPGTPHDAKDHPADVGELLWRGWVRPSTVTVDIVAGGLGFQMTPSGRNAWACRKAWAKEGA